MSVTGLPPGVMLYLKTVGHMSHQTAMTSIRANQRSAGNLLRHSVVGQIDEMGPAEAKAVDKVLQLPKKG